ncbi:MAG: DUF1501 domain-containing protein [Gemmataceae bacterium]
MFRIELGQVKTRRCDGHTRRDALQIGALSALGLGLPGLLRAESKQGTKHGAPAGLARGARAKSVILVYLGGGLSHHDSFDPKPEAPEEIRGKYKPLATNVSGVHFTEKLPLLAKQMSRFTLIRSGSHNNDHHETATNWVLSGRFGTPFGDYPALGAVVAHESGFRGTMPPYVAVPQNPSFTWELGRSAFLGGRFESFRAGDPNAKDFKVRDLAPLDKLSDDRRARRSTMLQAVDQLAKRVEGNDQIATFDEFHNRAAAMVLSSEARQAFDITAESNAVRDRFGRNTFGQSALLARRLVQAGTRFVTINFGGWDHHGKIFEGLDQKLPELDKGLSALFDDLTERKLHEETLVLVMGEFGRTPKINKEAGRDHWGQAGSLLFFGAGAKPGYVLGKTDKHGGYPTQRPVTPADVACTVLDAVGIDPRKELATPDGRPLAIVDIGEPVREIFT